MRKFAEPFLCETFGAAKEGDGVTALDDGERGERKLQSNTAYRMAITGASKLFVFYVLFLTRPLSHIITARQL